MHFDQPSQTKQLKATQPAQPLFNAGAEQCYANSDVHLDEDSEEEPPKLRIRLWQWITWPTCSSQLLSRT